ncbi:uncharacterized protein DS421_10g294980 [Arachis hypogaea]|nr:uncharacterized protein DS421_10g294980 [Arachis hypogaea]
MFGLLVILDMNRIAFSPQKYFGDTPSFSSFPFGTKLLLELDDTSLDAMGWNAPFLPSPASPASPSHYIRRIRAQEFHKLGWGRNDDILVLGD